MGHPSPISIGMSLRSRRMALYWPQLPALVPWPGGVAVRPSLNWMATISVISADTLNPPSLHGWLRKI